MAETNTNKTAYQRDLDSLFDMFIQKAQYYRLDITPILQAFSEREKLPPDPTRHVADDEFPKILEEERTLLKTQIRRAEKQSPKTPDEANFGRLHPVTVLGGMIRNLGFPDESTDVFMDALRKSFPIDQTTGYYSKKTMPAILGLAHLHAKQTDMPVTLVEGDLANLSGANIALGRKATDKLVHEIASVVKKRFEESAVEVHAVRMGGDELRLVVYGLNAQQTKDILKNDIHPRINKLMAQYGAHAIPHAKTGDKKLPGFGAAFACAQLDENSRPQDIRVEIGKQIEMQKLSDGMLRAGFVADKDGGMENAVDHYIKHIYEPYLDRNQVKAPEDRALRIEKRRGDLLKKPEMRKTALRNREYWQSLTSPGGVFADEAAAHPEHAGNPKAFFDSVAPATSLERDQRLGALPLDRKTNLKDLVPCYDEVVLPEYKAPMDPADLTFRKILSRLDFKRLANSNPDESALCQWNPDTTRVDWLMPLNEQEKNRGRELRLAFDMAYNLFDARDPTSFAKSDDLMIHDTESFVKAHGGAKVLIFEMKNLNGLNDISRDLADTALSSTRKIIEKNVDEKSKGLTGNLSGHIFHPGNGHFYVLLPPNYEDSRIANIVLGVTSSANTRIGRQNIVEFYSNPDGLSDEGQTAGPKNRLQHSLDEIKAADFKDKLKEIEGSIEYVRGEEAKKMKGGDNVHVILNTMAQIPSPKEPKGNTKDKGNYRFGITTYITAIGSGEDVTGKLLKIKEEANKHFDATKAQSAVRGRA